MTTSLEDLIFIKVSHGTIHAVDSLYLNLFAHAAERCEVYVFKLQGEWHHRLLFNIN